MLEQFEGRKPVWQQVIVLVENIPDRPWNACAVDVADERPRQATGSEAIREGLTILADLEQQLTGNGELCQSTK